MSREDRTAKNRAVRLDPTGLYKKILSLVATNKFQQRVFKFLEEEEADIVFLWGERGCGKSFGMILYLVLCSFRYGVSVDAFFTRKFKKSLINSGIIEEAADFVRGHAQSIHDESDAQDLSLTLKTGGKITFSGILNRQHVRRRFKGNHPSFLVVDEADETEEDTFKELLTCVRKKTNMRERTEGEKEFKTKVVVLSNPKSGCWLRDYIKPYLTEDGFVLPEMDGKKLFLFEGRNAYGERKKAFAETIKGVPEEQRKKALKVVSFYGKQEDNCYWVSQNEQYKGFLSLGLHEDEISWGRDVSEDGDLIFRKSDFQTISLEEMEEKLKGEGSLVMISCDFSSGSKSLNAGYSAICVYGFSKEEEFFVLELKEGRFNLNESIEIIKTLSFKWKTKGVIVERVQMGVTVIDALKDLDEGFEIIAVAHYQSIEKRLSNLRRKACQSKVFLSSEGNLDKSFVLQAIRYEQFTKAQLKNRKLRDDMLMTAAHAINTFQVDRKYLLSKRFCESERLILKREELLKEETLKAASKGISGKRRYGFSFRGVA